ncbi:MAG: serine/threonine-protein kinase [Planctomycetota bacterium]
MTDSKSAKQPLPADPGEESSLPMIDESDDSTQPVPSGNRSAGSATESSFAAGEALVGGSTGGFDTLLGKLVVERGLVTRDEIDLCNQMLMESSAGEEPRTLSDVMLDNDFLTRRQLDRMRTEFEAQRSTQQIPGYKIKRKLGSGAMATVFLARQLSLDRLVAIKVLPKKFSANTKFIERFYKEGRAAAQLNHPNIVSAYDVGQAGDHHYFVMEFVDGETLHERIVREKRVAENEAIDVIRQVALALQHAHERGFIHRDIKPKNIMLTKKGRVKLADLGLARAVSDKEAAKAEAGRAYGTPYYISPEQIRGEMKIGPAADIYGLGATFYHMVTGRVPYEGKNPSAVMHKHLKSELKPPDHRNPRLSPGCAQVIEKMLAKRQADRYHTAADLLEDLELIARGEAPHFARGELPASDLTDIATAAAQAPGTPPRVHEPEVPSVLSDTRFLIALVVMVVSLLVNLILMVVLLTG